MNDFKSKLPDLKELGSMTEKLFRSIKSGVNEIIEDYKKKRETSGEMKTEKVETVEKVEKVEKTEVKKEKPKPKATPKKTTTTKSKKSSDKD